MSIKKSLNIFVLFGIIISISFLYTVILYFAGKLYHMIHPLVGIYAHSFWFLLMLFLVLGPRLFTINEMKGVDGDSFKYFEEFIIGIWIGAMISFPFLFVFICETIEINKPLSFEISQIDRHSIFPWIRYSWKTTIDALTLGFSGTYNLFGGNFIVAESTFSKTVVLVYKISIDLLYIVSVLSIRKEIKALKNKTANNNGNQSTTT